MQWRKTITLLWMGAALASLFFYPLFSIVLKDSYLLQWSAVNTLELVIAYNIFLVMATLLLFRIQRMRSDHFRLILLVLAMLPSSLLFASQLVRHLEMSEQLVALITLVIHHPLRTLGMTLLVIALGLRLAWTHSRLLSVVAWRTLLVLSIVNVIAVQAFWSLRGIQTVSSIARDPSARAASSAPLPNIFVFLFDELSYDVLYDSGAVRANFPHFLALASVSDNYHHAESPGENTIPAIPSLLIVDHDFSAGGVRGDRVLLRDSAASALEQPFRHFVSDGETLFSLAQQRGYVTSAVGTFLQYCRTFRRDLNECETFSPFNFSTVRTRFSLRNPVLSNFAMIPHQLPSGLLKVPVFSIIQRSLIERTDHFIRRIIGRSKSSEFLFAHVFLPHLPFVFQRDGYAFAWDAFVQDAENYTHQLEYADTLLGTWMQQLKAAGNFDTSIIVVLSDHNYRKLFPAAKSHVPLIIKHPSQASARDINAPVHVDRALYSLLGRS